MRTVLPRFRDRRLAVAYWGLHGIFAAMMLWWAWQQVSQ